VAGPDNIDNVEIIACDDPIEMDTEHVEPRRGAPMPEQAWFDMLAAKRFFEERIVHQVNLADRQIIECSPISIHSLKLVSGQWAD
jgi:hypothetical protein